MGIFYRSYRFRFGPFFLTPMNQRGKIKNCFEDFIVLPCLYSRTYVFDFYKDLYTHTKTVLRCIIFVMYTTLHKTLSYSQTLYKEVTKTLNIVTRLLYQNKNSNCKCFHQNCLWPLLLSFSLFVYVKTTYIFITL